jgi:hypothetical protein
MTAIVHLVVSSFLLVSIFAYQVGKLLGTYRPVSADARRLRAHLRKEAPLKGRVDVFPMGAGLTDDMRREIGAAEGFRYTPSYRRPHFDHIGRSTGKLPDA